MSTALLLTAASRGFSAASQGSPLTAGTATATAGVGVVNLSATAPTGGTAPYTYQWYRSSGGVKGAAISGATGLTYADTGRTNGTTYSYVLTATDSVGASVDYTQVSATPTAAPGDTTAPAAPTGLGAPETVANLTIPLTWNAHPNTDGDLASFRAYYTTDGTSPTVDGSYLTVSSDPAATGASFTAVLPNTLYKIALAAVDNATPANISAISNVVSATTGDAPASNEPAGMTQLGLMDGTEKVPTGWNTSNNAWAGTGGFGDGKTAIVTDVDAVNGSALEKKWYGPETVTVGAGATATVIPVTLAHADSPPIYPQRAIRLTDTSLNISGTVSIGVSTTTTMTGVGTSFTTELAVGQYLLLGSSPIIRRVRKITSDTKLTFDPQPIAGEGLSGVTAQLLPAITDCDGTSITVDPPLPSAPTAGDTLQITGDFGDSAGKVGTVNLWPWSDQTPGAGPVQTLYVRLKVKPSAGFDLTQRFGGMKFFYLWTSKSTNNLLWVEDGILPGVGWRCRILDILSNSLSGGIQNWYGDQSAMLVPDGAYHTLEWLFQMNTVVGPHDDPASHNGVARLWIDGTRVIDHTDVCWVASDDRTDLYSPDFGGIHLDMLRGTQGAELGADDSVRIAEYYISGKV